MPARKVAIEIRKQGDSGPGTYALRSTFPPKPGSNRVRPYRQRLYTGIQALPQNKKRVTALARRVEAALLEGRFRWEDFESATEPDADLAALTVGQLLPGLRAHLEATRGISEFTWRRNYVARLKVRPGLGAVLEPDVIEGALRETSKGSATRKADVNALRLLCSYAGVEFDFTPWRSNYSRKAVAPIEVPNDEQIVALIDGLQDPGHRWLVGAIATWGLRPHEVWKLTVSSGSTRCEVHDRTKTGERVVPSLPAEWVERWALDQKLLPQWSIPDSDLAAPEITNRVGRVLRRAEFGFRPYSLRHAWAIRCLRKGIPIGVSAKCMGHTTQEHSSTYQKWITDQQILETFEEFT